MDIDRQKRLLQLIEEALDQPSENRARFLDQACGSDTELRLELESALGESESLLDGPAFDIHSDDLRVGQEIGPYRLERLIERGGMGAVYEAVRQDLDKRVALKIVRQGFDLDTGLLRRFRDEQRILAHLEHPMIARLLDAGTTDDKLPYFVMEYVDGVPIDQYCQRRELDIRARVELVRKICFAVQFAHQNLVVHRDLKPANILVDADGEPKLLDFGIAKLLVEDGPRQSAATVAGFSPMTLRYASPEQGRLEPVRTSSDVYALGVVLYELLAGKSPYHPVPSRSDQLLKAVQELDPKAPSEVVDEAEAKSELRGDLDAIVLRSLEKEPAERYGSAEQLAADLGRHLDGLPVSARTATFPYRATRFVRRHRWGVGLAVLVAAMILVFGIVADSLRRQAEVEREWAEQTSELLEDIFGGVIRGAQKGESIEGEDLLEVAEQTLEERAREGVDSRLVIEWAGQLGKLFREMGDSIAAERLLDWAHEVANQSLDPDDPEVLTAEQNLTIKQLFDQGDYRAAEFRLRQILAKRRSSGQTGKDLFKNRSNLASALMMQGKLAEAEAFHRDILVERQARRASGLDDDVEIGSSHQHLAAFFYLSGDFGRAEAHLRQATEIRRALSERSTALASTLDLWGRVAIVQGDEQRAEELLQRALEMRLAILDEDHYSIARTRLALAGLRLSRDSAEARNLLQKALGPIDALSPIHWLHSEVDIMQGRLAAAEDNYGRAEDLLSAATSRLEELRGANTTPTLRARHFLDEVRRARSAAKVSAAKVEPP